MRLTTRQIEHTLDQIEAQAIPDDNPVIPQLNSTLETTRSFSTVTA